MSGWPAAGNFEPHCSQKLLVAGFLTPHFPHSFISGIQVLLEVGCKAKMTVFGADLTVNYTHP
ncbi:MAG TPA: hypothetical protein VJ873_04950 [bacterium]|nr:hypothetical protein [bacterium]